MPSKLAKVQKAVSKKKGAKATALHENSRDAKRLRRAGARDDRVAKTNSVKEKANRLWVDRVLYFQEHLPDTLHPLELEKMQELVQNYVQRYDDEIEALRAERRPGRPASTRQTLLEQAQKNEAQEYEAGFWAPDLADAETLLKLDSWKGDWASLAYLRFVRIDRNGGLKESRFPPRGAS